MTLPFSDESLEVIEANECQGFDLTSSRFRRVFLEIDKQKDFCATVAAALRELRASVAADRRVLFAFVLDEIDTTIAALGLGDQGEERKCS